MADILVKVFSHCPSKEIWLFYADDTSVGLFQSVYIRVLPEPL